MKEIFIGGSEHPAIVDNEDYDKLIVKTWRAARKKNGTCYAVHDVRTEDGKVIKLLMHREVLQAQSGSIVDHVNRNGLDNRRQNLRFVTNSQNCWNRIGVQNTTSKYKGVSWDRRRIKWRAKIVHNGKIYHIGRFDSEEEAALAYNKKAIELYGEYACLNIVE